VRADASGDEKVDLSDAVATLGYLFLGGGELPCLNAADSDDSGVIEITDAIFLLGYLFLGQRSIPEPYPACGLDPSPDLLGCRLGCRGLPSGSRSRCRNRERGKAFRIRSDLSRCLTK